MNWLDDIERRLLSAKVGNLVEPVTLTEAERMLRIARAAEALVAGRTQPFFIERIDQLRAAIEGTTE